MISHLDPSSNEANAPRPPPPPAGARSPAWTSRDCAVSPGPRSTPGPGRKRLRFLSVFSPGLGTGPALCLERGNFTRASCPLGERSRGNPWLLSEHLSPALASLHTPRTRLLCCFCSSRCRSVKPGAAADPLAWGPRPPARGWEGASWGVCLGGRPPPPPQDLTCGNPCVAECKRTCYFVSVLFQALPRLQNALFWVKK